MRCPYCGNKKVSGSSFYCRKCIKDWSNRPARRLCMKCGALAHYDSLLNLYRCSNYDCKV